MLPLFLCFLSGAAGLVYEVTWTRLAVLLVGATAPAVATVLACFMAGLGLGAWVGGRLADRSTRPLALYGLAELGIAAWGAGLCGLQSVVSVGDLALSGPLGLLAAFAAIGPPTLAMGATLPLLVRGLTTSISSTPRDAGASRRLASLYAVNTAGAVVGALAAGFLLVEQLGLRGAQLAAAAANGSAGVLALAFLSRWKSKTNAIDEAPDPESTAAGRPVPALGLAALTGLCAIALEVLLTRALDLLTYSTVYAFSAILAVFLVGIAAGSAACGRRIGRLASPRRALLGCLGVLAVGALAAPVLLAVMAVGSAEALRSAGAHGVPLRLVLVAAVVVLGPTLASGAAFPLLVRLHLARLPPALHPDDGRAVGAGVGAVYLANTAGSVAGLLLGGFVLLPRLGLQGGLLAVGGLALLGALALADRAGLRAALATGIGAAVALAAIPLLGVSLPRDLYASLDEDWRIVATDDDPGTSLMVAQSRRDPDRMGLWLDGNYVAGTGGGHLLLAHLPMLRHGAVREVLGACMGTGQTFGATAEYDLARLDLVELSPSVVRAARSLFARFDRGLFDRPNVAVHLGDARRFVRGAPARYDLVTAEPLQPWTRGTVTLYSREYYRQVRRVLRPGGLAVQWIPLYEVSPADLRGIIATFQESFPAAELWLDYRDVILVGGAALAPLDEEALAARMAAPHVRADLERIHLDDARTLLAKRVMGPAALARFARGARIITDGDPYLEMTAPRAIDQGTEWRHFRDFIEAWDLDFGGGRDAAGLRAAAEATRESLRVDLAEHDGLADSTAGYLHALSIYPRHSQVFARAAGRVARDAAAGHPRAAEQYEELLRLRPDAGKAWINYGALLLERGELERAERAFAQGGLAAPATPEVRAAALLNLGVAYARGGKYEKARGAWRELLALTPGDPRVRAYLDRLPPPPPVLDEGGDP